MARSGEELDQELRGLVLEVPCSWAVTNLPRTCFKQDRLARNMQDRSPYNGRPKEAYENGYLEVHGINVYYILRHLDLLFLLHRYANSVSNNSTQFSRRLRMDKGESCFWGVL